MKKIFIVLLFIFFAQAAQAAEEFTVRIQPGPEKGKDTFYGTTYSKNGDPERDVLKLGGWGDNYYSFLEFDISTIPEKAEIINATIGLFHMKVAGSKNYGIFERITDDWNEYGVDLNNNPDSVDFGFSPSLVEIKEYWWTNDITGVVQGWHNGQYDNYGVKFFGQRNSSDAGRQFYSSDYLDDPSLRPYLEITYTLPDEEEAVDPLVLQYAPKLALHPDEDYVPMDVIDFVDASALWDMGGADSQLYDAVSLTPEVFENEIDVGGTSEYYLAFSDPDTKKSIDLAAAKAKYDALDGSTTVYYHKVDDGDYTVLQYWYFYAMNNWKEHGGFNNHEGDWESVFVYLDKGTQEPEYVAYSAHHNDGNRGLNVFQYDSVRRGWESNEIEKNGDTVTSFVALGSHANYPNNGDGTHSTRVKDDETSAGGSMVLSGDFLSGNAITASAPFWMDYKGKWGADRQNIPGGDGPQGPAFSDVSGHVRFLNPVEWAGIDKIEKVLTDGTQTEFDFSKAEASMRFAQPPTAGKRLTIDPHSEWISFGDNEQGVTLLPKFWDIDSTLTNGTFDVDVSFEYDPQVVAELGGDQRTLGVYHYDEAQKQWVRQRSIVDIEGATVSFVTSHFSRYALGFVDEEVYIENLFDQLRKVIAESSLHRMTKRMLVRKVHLAERLASKDRRGTKIAAKRMLTYVEKATDRLVRFRQLTKVEASEIDSLVQRLLVMIR